MDRKIRLFNPWWEENKIPPELYSENHFKNYQLIEDLLYNKKVIAILGARQSGKTYLLYYIIDLLFKKKVPPQNILFLSMDDKIINLENALSYYERIILKKSIQNSHEQYYIFLDEIQLFDNWQEVLKQYIGDLYPLKFILASSSINHFQNISLIFNEKDYSEIQIFPLQFEEYLLLKKTPLKVPGYSFSEILNFTFFIKGKLAFIDHINEFDNLLRDFIIQGGYYRYINEINPLIRTQKIISQIVDMAIYKDISIIYDVRNPRKIEDFLLYIARNTSSIFQFDYLSKLFSLTSATLENYVHYLESSFLIYPVYNLSLDYNRNLLAPKKIYFSDLGVRNSIVGETSINLKDIDVLVDNCIYLHLKSLKSKYKLNISFWRKDTSVVDIVVEYENAMIPIEICYKSKDFKIKERNILRFCEEFNCKKGIIINKNILEVKHFDDCEILILPASIFLFAN